NSRGAEQLKDLENMDQLKKLWIEQGDFGRLLNDQRARALTGSRPQSLLDGRHMYRELLKALEGMEAPNGAGRNGGGAKQPESPYAEELDLFVTTTDISGLTLPLQLAAGVVKERRHRNVFHFVYTTEHASGERRNDFDSAHNPFLAFAARCTSSFPVAFEPMKLGDIDGVVSKLDGFKDRRKDELTPFLSGSAAWRKFIKDYVEARKHKLGGEDEAAREFAERAFADGGALDNKPFSYATDALLRRRADLPVDRKLVFIDPDPHDPDKDPDFDRDVDVLQNTMSALSPTVSTETIREDIERVLERNRLIERVREVTDHAEQDVRRFYDQRHEETREQSRLEGKDWARISLDEAIKDKGIAYGGYHRLKVYAVTDWLAGVVTRAAGLDESSDEFIFVRDYVRAWRDLTYEESPVCSEKPTRNNFLLDFDLDYRLRRLRFLREVNNRLSCTDYAGPGAEAARARLTEDLRRAKAAAPDGGDWAAFQSEFRKELHRARVALNDVHRDVLKAQRGFQLRGAQNPLHKAVERLVANGLTKDAVWAFLSEQDEHKRVEKARGVLTANSGRMRRAFDRAAVALVYGLSVEEGEGRPAKEFDGLKDVTDGASAECRRILAPGGAGGAASALALLRSAYEGFEDYDMVRFPITYQTGVGETEVVDVIRISPYDSKNLIDEGSDGGRRKLAGTSLGHFGAFLEPSWRKNDIMWGRLDAAERIIRTLLPPPAT
ncbi:MAG TPA: patatin-like protein, partial [Pyrinomonadaceae bacterium]|nr:patatin-like protein [Pyrinomonadaceae bacterium]